MTLPENMTRNRKLTPKEGLNKAHLADVASLVELIDAGISGDVVKPSQFGAGVRMGSRKYEFSRLARRFLFRLAAAMGFPKDKMKFRFLAGGPSVAGDACLRTVEQPGWEVWLSGDVRSFYARWVNDKKQTGRNCWYDLVRDAKNCSLNYLAQRIKQEMPLITGGVP